MAERSSRRGHGALIAMPISLDAEQVRWILYGGATMTVASRSAAMRPSIGQVLGCRVEAGSSRLTLFLLASRSRAAVADMRAGREVALVMTRSSTTRSLQVKAPGATEVPMTDPDRDRVRDYIEIVVRQWAQDGVPPAFTRTLLVSGPGPILAFEIEMAQAFDQTPGPRAGESLRGAR